MTYQRIDMISGRLSFLRHFDESFMVLTLMNLLADHCRPALKCHSDLSLWYASSLSLSLFSSLMSDIEYVEMSKRRGSYYSKVMTFYACI